MRRKRRTQCVVKLKGDYDLVKDLRDLIEQRTTGITSEIMNSDQGDYHCFITVFEVIE